MRPPPGLTTIEVLVAIMLLGGATLATLSVHATLTRMGARANQRRLLAIAGAYTLDSLRATPCAAISSGAAVLPSGRLSWTTRRQASSVTITLALTPTGASPWRAETIVPCL